MKQEFKGFFLTQRIRQELVDGNQQHAGFNTFTSAKLQGTVQKLLLDPVTDLNGKKYISFIVDHDPASRTILAKVAEGTGLWDKVKALKLGDFIKVTGIQQHGRQSRIPHVSVQAFGEPENITVRAGK